MYTDRLMANCWRGWFSPDWDPDGKLPAITLSFMPISHVMGRVILYSTLGVGGTAYFAARSDLSTLLEDLALVRPTKLDLVPRIWEMLFQEVQSEIDHRWTDGADRDTVERQVMAEQREKLIGGRQFSAMTGSAPISPELRAWVEDFLDIHLTEVYGSTEDGIVLVDDQIQRPPVTRLQARRRARPRLLRHRPAAPARRIIGQDTRSDPRLLQAPRGHRRTLRRRRLVSHRRRDGRDRDPTSWSMWTAATTCSSSRRASSSPSPSWRRPTAATRRYVRSSCTATAPAPICSP